LDLANEPDAPTLRRPDGAFVARFSAKDMTYEAVERVAFEDRLFGTSQAPSGGELSSFESPHRPRLS
jgi:hypothetical protein